MKQTQRLNNRCHIISAAIQIKSNQYDALTTPQVWHLIQFFVKRYPPVDSRSHLYTGPRRE